VVAPTEGPPLSTPELVAATPNGELMGIGSDGGAGVWFAEDGPLHEDAFMVHYLPTGPDLTRLPLTVASPFNELIQGITPGPKGTEWFARFYDNEISHITARGKLVTKKLPPSSEPQDVAVNQQGAVWFTERGHGCALGRLWPKGKLTTYSPFGADCYDLTIGPNETVWVADYASNQVVEVSGATGEVIGRYNLRLPVGIATVGEDIYVTEDEPAVVAKITPEGEVTEYLLPEGRKLEWMTAGPDDAVWFDEIIGAGGVPAIGRLTPGGELREVPVPGGGGGDIAATNDAIYFTEGSGPEAGVMRIPASSTGGGGSGPGVSFAEQYPCTAVGWGSVVVPGSTWAPGVSGDNNVYSNNQGGNCANSYSQSRQVGDVTLPAYQCTELAVRWAWNFGGVDPAAWSHAGWNGAAYDMYGLSVPGTQDIANGAGTPEFGDLLVWNDGGLGHVAVVLGVSGNKLYFVGENEHYSEDYVNFNQATNTARSTPFDAGTVTGWIRFTK
jgi:streptogramin lyase/surface antigen